MQSPKNLDQRYPLMILMILMIQGRVIYSHNISDFCRLHSQYLELGRNHAGIALIPQNTTIGNQVRAIVAFVSQKTLENMQNECIFLSQFLSI